MVASPEPLPHRTGTDVTPRSVPATETSTSDSSSERSSRRCPISGACSTPPLSTRLGTVCEPGSFEVDSSASMKADSRTDDSGDDGVLDPVDAASPDLRTVEAVPRMADSVDDDVLDPGNAASAVLRIEADSGSPDDD